MGEQCCCSFHMCYSIFVSGYTVAGRARSLAYANASPRPPPPVNSSRPPRSYARLRLGFWSPSLQLRMPQPRMTVLPLPGTSNSFTVASNSDRPRLKPLCGVGGVGWSCRMALITSSCIRMHYLVRVERLHMGVQLLKVGLQALVHLVMELHDCQGLDREL